MKIKLSRIKLGEVLLMVLLLCSSWEFIVPVTVIDEVVLIVLILYIIIVHKKVDKLVIKIICIYIMYCLGGIVVNMRMNSSSITALVDNIKPIIFLVMITALSLDKNTIKRIVCFFERINVVSIFVGILNVICHNYLHINLLVGTGRIRMVAGKYVYRMGGLTGHTGIMSEICAILIILTIFNSKLQKKHFVKLAFYFMGMYFAGGRLPMIVSLVAIVFFMWGKIKLKMRKYLLVFFGVVMGTFAYPVVNYVTQLYQTDIENQIRFIAIRLIYSMITSVLFFGVGIGNIGNANSIVYNRDLYQHLDVIRYGGFDWESTIAKNLLQTGVIGTALWYAPFLINFYRVIKSNGEYKNMTVFIFGYYLANTILNKAYSIPFLFILCILSSYQAGNREVE
jgi:hypothetical protein